MTVYAIILREGPVTDPEAMAEYLRVGQENRGNFDMKPLVLYGALEAIEGKASDGAVILEFPNMEEAKAWYYSPGYQMAAPHRIRSADYRIMFVEGFAPPPA